MVKLRKFSKAMCEGEFDGRWVGFALRLDSIGDIGSTVGPGRPNPTTTGTLLNDDPRRVTRKKGTLLMM